MVGRGVSLNQISSMWTSFNPPIVMSDEHEAIDARDLQFMEEEEGDEDENEDGYEYEEEEEEEDEENYQEGEDGQFETSQFDDCDSLTQNNSNIEEIRPNIKQEPVDY